MLISHLFHPMSRRSIRVFTSWYKRSKTQQGNHLIINLILNGPVGMSVAKENGMTWQKGPGACSISCHLTWAGTEPRIAAHRVLT